MNVASLPRKNDGRKGFAQIFPGIHAKNTETMLVCPDEHTRYLDATVLSAVAHAIARIENEIVEDHNQNIYVMHHPNHPGIVEISWGEPVIGLLQFDAEALLLQIDPWLVNMYLAKKSAEAARK